MRAQHTPGATGSFVVQSHGQHIRTYRVWLEDGNVSLVERLVYSSIAAPHWRSIYRGIGPMSTTAAIAARLAIAKATGAAS